MGNSLGGWGWGWLGQDTAGLAGDPVLILDNFTAANGTNLNGRTPSPTNAPGNAWVEDNGDWDIQANAANNTGDTPASPRWLATIDAEQANVIVEVVITATAGGAVAGIAGRFIDSGNFWAIYLDIGDDLFYIVEWDGGGDTLRDSAAVTLAAATPYTVRATFSGTSIAATVNGGNQISYTSSLHQNATKFGIHERAAVTDTRFDNFKVETA